MVIGRLMNLKGPGIEAPPIWGPVSRFISLRQHREQPGGPRARRQPQRCLTAARRLVRPSRAFVFGGQGGVQWKQCHALLACIRRLLPHFWFLF